MVSFRFRQDPPPLQVWSMEHTLVGKLEGTQRREHRMLTWEAVIEEVDGLDVDDPEESEAPLMIENDDGKEEDDGDDESPLELRRQVFRTLDTEGTGVLGKEQVRRLVQEIDGGTELSEEELDAAMAAMDDDGNGTVDFEEFSEWWIKRTEEDISSEEDQEDEDEDEGEEGGEGLDG